MLIVANLTGITILVEKDGVWAVLRQALVGTVVRSIIAREGVILVASEDGVLRSDDLGASWYAVNVGLEQRAVLWLAYHPDVSDYELVGTDDGIFVSEDGALSWRRLPLAHEANDALSHPTKAAHILV